MADFFIFSNSLFIILSFSASQYLPVCISIASAPISEAILICSMSGSINNEQNIPASFNLFIQSTISLLDFKFNPPSVVISCLFSGTIQQA